MPAPMKKTILTRAKATNFSYINGNVILPTTPVIVSTKAINVNASVTSCFVTSFDTIDLARPNSIPAIAPAEIPI